MSPLFPPDTLPISGEVQFWRLHPDHWEAVLDSVQLLGIDTIATYLSWRRHEPRPGSFDLRGRHAPELDVHRFLELCRDRSLRVILKPGPWICAEETNGGFPDWIVDDDSLIALDWQRRPVSGYNPPFKHPMPSYASRTFRHHVDSWITRVWTDLRDYTGPDGPVVATQYDNEPSLGFQDSMYGFDYHPDALIEWRRTLGDDTAEPPTPRSGPPTAPTSLERSWADWHRDYIADYLSWLAQRTTELAPCLAGTVNLNTHPVRGWPQDGPTLTRSMPRTVVGEDHYFRPPLDEADIAGVALAAAQARLSDTPMLWAPEMQAGIWRSPGEEVGYPDPTPDELAAWWATALALGYRGFNLYMLADRDNWDLAPISPIGQLSPVGHALKKLIDTVRQIPSLAAFSPRSDLTLRWGDDLRRSAYRVRGTQAKPVTAYDAPLARAAYDAVETDALRAVQRGRHFALGLDAADAGTTAVRSMTPGVLARIHTADDGAELLWIVRWSRRAVASVAQIELSHPGRLRPFGGNMTESVEARTHYLPADGSVLQLFTLTR